MSKTKSTNGATKRKPKPLKLGRTPGDVYALAETIIAARRWLTDGKWEAQRALARDPRSVAPFPGNSDRYDDEKWADWKAMWTRLFDQFSEARAMFEARLVVDPADAVRRISGLQRMPGLDIRNAKGGGDPVLKAALAPAVEHVEEWLRQRDGKPTETNGTIWLPAPVLLLRPLAVGFPKPAPSNSGLPPVEFELKDLERLAENATVKKARRGDGAKKRGGYKTAAIALVALATGQGEQTVKRAAAGSKRAED